MNQKPSPQKKIFFDVTLLRSCPKRPTGILRVSSEFCRWFLKNAPTQVEFCFYEKTMNRFFVMQPSHVKKILESMCNPPSVQTFSIPKFLRKIVVLAKKAKLILSNKKASFNNCSVYFDLGLNARNSFLETLLKNKNKYGFKLATFCHDLIPVLEPQFAWIENQKSFDNINNFFKFIGKYSNHIFCVSKHTQKDLLFFLKNNNIPASNTSIFVNGSNLSHNFSKSIKSLHDLTPNNYILYVSSIDKRKNHDIIYKAYRLLKERGKKNLPKMVFVGAHLGGGRHFLNYMTWDPNVKDLMISLDNVSDIELEWLYKNCLFTVYPSLYEGWGIPVAESLERGKFCLASSATSIPEVGGDFIEYIHPLDTFTWAQKISHFIDNPEMLNERIQQIQKYYKPQFWDDSIKEAYQTLLVL